MKEEETVANITLRRFAGGYGMSEDFYWLHDFLAEAGNTQYTYGRLDWMITHRPYLEEESLCRIGIWEEDGRIVAADLFDTSMDDIFPIVRKGYESLYPQIIEYALENMIREEEPDFRLMVFDGDEALEKAAREAGLIPTEEIEHTARIDLDAALPETRLPAGFSVVTMAEEKDYEKYMRCLFKGFNHELDGETFTYTEEDERTCRDTFESGIADPALRVSVKAPDGSYVAHCGMWYEAKAGFALIEPVATDPDYRRMGLGRAAVTEGLRRVQALGARFAVVGSDQQFYYAIGMRPYQTGTFWVRK